MKHRTPKPDISSWQEEESVRALREILSDSVEEQQPASYWANLLVRTNQRIDAQTSGKALSLSWAARVAIPGVVVIISFFIGLHYYVPESSRSSTLVGPLLADVTDQDLDSLYAAGTLYSSVLDDPLVGLRLFDVTGDHAAEYLLTIGRESIVLETFSDSQVNELLSVLNVQ